MDTFNNSLDSDGYNNFGLPTPTSYLLGLPSDSNQWSLSLTPGSIFARGITPGTTLVDHGNPFETSFDVGSSRRETSRLRSNMTDEDLEVRTPDALSTYTRKRALSSPSLFPSTGSSWDTEFNQELAILAGMGTSSTNSNNNHKRIKVNSLEHEPTATYSNFALDSEHSSLSSAAFTPTDSTTTSMDEDNKNITPPMFSISLPKDQYSNSISTTTTSFPNFFNHQNSSHSISSPSLSLPVTASYEQFMFPPQSIPSNPTIESASPFIFQLARHKENLAAAAANHSYIQVEPQAVLVNGTIVPSSVTSSSNSQSKKEAKALKKELKANAKKGKGKKNLDSVNELVEGLNVVGGEVEEILDEATEEAKRKEFLERNRIAASKSRQKKKEKVGNLERDANEICKKNFILQSEAFSLRDELLILRSLVDTHDGCNCEHVKGYLRREEKGGGIPLINILAGRTFELDYKKVPTMGSNDDVYVGVEGLILNTSEFSENVETVTSTGKPEKLDGRTLAGKKGKAFNNLIASGSTTSKKIGLEGNDATSSSSSNQKPVVLTGRSRKSSTASSLFEEAVLKSPDLGILTLPSTFTSTITEQLPSPSSLHRTRSSTLTQANMDQERQLRSSSNIYTDQSASPYFDEIIPDFFPAI